MAWFDVAFIICLLAAFISGLQEGIMRSIGWIVMFTLSVLIAVLSAPYLIRFMEYSFGMKWLAFQLGFMMLFLLFLLWLSSKPLILVQRNPKSKGYMYGLRFIGASTMFLITLFSISVLTGFLEKTQITPPQNNQASISYQVMHPVRQSTSILWKELKNGMDDVSRKGNEARHLVNQD